MISVQARLDSKPAFSWRDDVSVPAFDDTRPLIVFDGVCVLCSRSMGFVARHEVGSSLQFTSAQSKLGQALFEHFALDPETFETVILLEHGRALGKRDAVAGIARHLRSPWRAGGLFRRFPRGLADALYDQLAGRRYRWFGRTATCFVPDPSWRSRVLD